MDNEPKLMPQYYRDDRKIDLPENCEACKLMYAQCDTYCFHGSEECLKNLWYHQKKRGNND